MFTICQGTCFCAASSDSKHSAEETVLYCFGEVVLKKNSLRGEKEQKAETKQLDDYHLQLTQIVVIFILLTLILLVLLLIRKGLTRILTQLRRISRLMGESREYTGYNETSRRDKDYLRKENQNGDIGERTFEDYDVELINPPMLRLREDLSV